MFNYFNEVVQEDMKNIYQDDLPFEKLKNKSILITGATGMLATYLVYFFHYLNIKINLNIQIFILVRNLEKAEKIFQGLINEEYFKILVQDVTEEVELENSIDLIFHLASSANPDSISKNPTSIIKANTLGTINICEFARKKNAKVFFSSTREVYGKINEGIIFIKENDMGIIDPAENRACYPESKRISETICHSYFLQYGINYQIARIAHVYGPGMNIKNDGRIMADIIFDVLNNQDIILRSDGSALRAFCYLSDAIRGIMSIILCGSKNEIYNLSNEVEEISIKELAELCVLLFPEKRLSIKYEISNNSAYTTYKRIGLDNTKLHSLGWNAKISLSQGLKKTVESY